MRLDKMLSECGVASRSESSRAARAGKITVNGVSVRKADVAIDPERDEVSYCGKPVRYRKYVYLMLNKPDGYISATEDGRGDPVVTDLLDPEYRKMGVFPCGRLDKHTLGLMLLTNDGALSHRLLAPKSHVAKSYAFSVKFHFRMPTFPHFARALISVGTSQSPVRWNCRANAWELSPL